MRSSRNIFRAYDIRGVYGKDLNEETAELVGKAFGTFVGKERIVGVGRDVRSSGLGLKRRLTEGLTSVGCDVIDFDMVTTPMLSIFVRNRQLDGAVMVTASHNPAEWNGFILINKSGHFCSEGMGMEEIRQIVLDKKFSETSKQGSVSREDGLEDYIDFILSKVKITRRLKVVLDPGNGSASLIAKKIFEKVGCEVVAINDYPDGNFPARAPDVIEDALAALKKKVVEARADIGIAFDCDVDRAAFIDEKGGYLGSGNITIALFADYYLSTNPARKIVFDVACSSAVEEFVRSRGGIPVVNRVGHAFIINRMIEENAIFGGEYSNHLYFSDIYGSDDAIFAGLKMAEILSKKNKRLSELVASVPRYPNAIKEISCSDEKKFEVVENIKKRLEDDGYKILALDGVKVYTDKGAFLIRASNTTPAIKLSSEAKNDQDLRELSDFAKHLIEDELDKSGFHA